MNDIDVIINNVLNMVMWPLFSGIVVIIFLYAGIMFLTASGDPTKIDKAKKAVIWGVVGIAVGILGYSAVSFIKMVLGV